MKEIVYNVTEQDFNEKVARASYESAVVIDFWADWCAPCKMLGPILEKVVRSFGGRVLLAKIDVDSNQGLAAQFGIRSIPSVKIVKDGAVVQEFTGAVPEAQLRSVIESVVGDANGDDLETAEKLFSEERFKEARRVYESILDDDPSNIGAIIGLARIDIRLGKPDNARKRLSSVEEGSDGYEEAQSMLAGLDFLSVCSGVKDKRKLADRYQSNAGDLEAGYSLGCCYAAEGKYREAFETFLSVFKKDRNYGDGKAKDAMITLFGIAGQQSELTAEYRQKLANELF